MQDKSYSRLRTLYPWPHKRPLSESDAFNWTPDGGGRELLSSMFDQRKPKLMMEVGSFMGGSALCWLRENPAMKLVCIDPFSNNNAVYIRSIIDAPWAARYGQKNLEKYAKLIDRRGSLNVVRNNLWDYRSRVVLIPGRIQDKTSVLEGLNPDVSFAAAMKVRDEFQLLDRLFPDAVFAGENWNWVSKDGSVPIPILAEEIASRRGGSIYAKNSKYLINEPRWGMEFPQNFLYRPPPSGAQGRERSHDRGKYDPAQYAVMAAKRSAP